MKENGIIDHITIAFFVEEDSKRKPKSTIKFGGMDKEGLKKNSNLNLIRTVKNDSWDLQMNFFKLGQDNLSTYGLIRFEPQLPWLYLPMDFFEVFAAKMNVLYFADYPEVCSTTENICKFPVACDKVKRHPLDISFRIFDDFGTYNY